MTNLSNLENQVLQMALSGDDEVLAVLRRQAREVRVSSREMTGVAFFAELAVPPEAPCVAGQPTFKLGDVNGSAFDLKHGLGFLLYIADGKLSALEGYTYDEPWPEEISGSKLTYSGGQDRDWDAIRNVIHKNAAGLM
jgi:hypothetical protein